MATGQKYVFSDGMECKSQLDALLHLKNNPTLTVIFSELTMAGVRETGATERLQAILNDNPYGHGR